MEKKAGRQRFWEIDLLRGVAVCLMIVLHALIDPFFLGDSLFRLNLRIWYFWQKITAALFLLLVGISLSLGRSRAERHGEEGALLRRNLRKGAAVFAWGMVVTAVTRIFMKEGFVCFGVLHLIGLSVLVSYPFLKLRFANVLLGTLCLWLGICLNGIRAPVPWLFWLGVVPAGFFSIDYMPVFPWFGLVLWGIFLGDALYPGYARSFPLRDASGFPVVRGVSFLGRHSLTIYLAHQPILLGIYRLLGVVKFCF